MKPYLLCDENGTPAYTLDATARANDYGAQDAYQNMYNFLVTEFSKEFIIRFFTYDWRLSGSTNAARLETFVANDKKVTIVAHSMGGLVASSYLMKQQNRTKLRQLITIGTPYMGSVRALTAFESGEILDKFTHNVVMGGHIRDILVNLASTYELLPTSRYPMSYIKNTTPVYSPTGDLTHAQARNYIVSQCSWVKKSNGTVKPMFANGEAFHNSLYIGTSHVADYVGATYIYGTNTITPSQIVYALDMGGQQFVNYVNVTTGDGTVIAASAQNGSSQALQISGVGHTDLMSDIGVKTTVKGLIRGASSPSNMPVNPGISEHETLWEANLDLVSVVIQGATELEIVDSNGAAVLRDGETLYVLNNDMSKTRVGYVWLLSYERQRYQYILAPGDYCFKIDEFASDISSEVLALVYDSGICTSIAEYNDLPVSSNINVVVSAEHTHVTDDSGVMINPS